MNIASCDTNILLHALNGASPYHDRAASFVKSHRHNPHFRICELVLVELYVLLRNPAVIERPLGAPEAAEICGKLRKNPAWGVLDYPGPLARVMEQVWRGAASAGFARRRIFDARLAYTLLHYGVGAFYSQNVRDFQDFGFRHLEDPLL